MRGDVLVREWSRDAGALVARHYRCDPPLRGRDGEPVPHVVVHRRQVWLAVLLRIIPADEHGRAVAADCLSELFWPHDGERKIEHEHALAAALRIGAPPRGGNVEPVDVEGRAWEVPDEPKRNPAQPSWSGRARVRDPDEPVVEHDEYERWGGRKPWHNVTASLVSSWAPHFGAVEVAAGEGAVWSGFRRPAARVCP